MHLWNIEVVLLSTIISLNNKNGNHNYHALNGVFWSHYTQLYFWSITMISRLLEIVKMSLNQNVKFDLVSQWNTLTSMSQDVIDNKCKVETVPKFKINSIPFIVSRLVWRIFYSIAQKVHPVMREIHWPQGVTSSTKHFLFWGKISKGEK